MIQYLYRVSHFSCTTAINIGPGFSESRSLSELCVSCN